MIRKNQNIVFLKTFLFINFKFLQKKNFYFDVNNKKMVN